MRLAKLDFLRFDGEKIKEWVSKAGQFFVIDNTLEYSNVGTTSLTCHEPIIQDDEQQEIKHSWRTYKLLIRERYDEILHDPIVE